MSDKKQKPRLFSELSPQKKAELFEKYMDDLQHMQKAGRIKTDLKSDYGIPQSNSHNAQDFEHPRLKTSPVSEPRNIRANWFQRLAAKNPKTIHIIGVTTFLLIFSSRPIYDMFLRKHIDPDSVLPPKDFSHLKIF